MSRAVLQTMHFRALWVMPRHQRVCSQQRGLGKTYVEAELMYGRFGAIELIRHTDRLARCRIMMHNRRYTRLSRLAVLGYVGPARRAVKAINPRGVVDGQRPSWQASDEEQVLHAIVE